VLPRVYQPVPKDPMASGVSGGFSRLLLLNWLHWLSNTALRLDHLRYDELVSWPELNRAARGKSPFRFHGFFAWIFGITDMRDCRYQACLKRYLADWSRATYRLQECCVLSLNRSWAQSR
jgi:hypothetical protein